MTKKKDKGKSKKSNKKKERKNPVAQKAQKVTNTQKVDQSQGPRLTKKWVQENKNRKEVLQVAVSLGINPNKFLGTVRRKVCNVIAWDEDNNKNGIFLSNVWQKTWVSPLSIQRSFQKDPK